MALERTPWAIGGGAEMSAALPRIQAFASTGGKSGVAAAGDLKVAAQSVPNGSVRVYPGVATIVNTYAGGAGQAYVGRNLSNTTVTINPTGSASARSDLLVLSVTDPEFEGTAPTDPNDFDYLRLEVISGVSSSQRDLSGLNFPRPAIPLARIDLPASTGTITAGMIKDVRVLPNPRTERRIYTLQPTKAEQLEYPTPNFTNFPEERFQVAVPEWANHAVIRAEIGSMWINGSAATQAIVIGRIRFMLGNVATQNSFFHHRSNGSGMRFGSSVADTIEVPEEFQGRVVGSAIQLMSGEDSNAGWHLDSSSFATLDIEFQERAL